MTTFANRNEMTLDGRKLLDVEVSRHGYFSHAVWADTLEDLENEELDRLDARYPDELWLAVQELKVG